MADLAGKPFSPTDIESTSRPSSIASHGAGRGLDAFSPLRHLPNGGVKRQYVPVTMQLDTDSTDHDFQTGSVVTSETGDSGDNGTFFESTYSTAEPEEVQAAPAAHMRGSKPRTVMRVKNMVAEESGLMLNGISFPAGPVQSGIRGGFYFEDCKAVGQAIQFNGMLSEATVAQILTARNQTVASSAKRCQSCL